MRTLITPTTTMSNIKKKPVRRSVLTIPLRKRVLGLGEVILLNLNSWSAIVEHKKGRCIISPDKLKDI